MTPYDILMQHKFEIDVERDDEVKPDMWLKKNPFNLKPVQVADIRPYVWNKKEEKPLVEYNIQELHEKLLGGIDRELDKCLKNKRLSQHADLMDTVMYAKFATDKVEEEKMERGCSNCKYEELQFGDMPCRDCCCNDRWKPKEEKMDNNRIILCECEKMAKKYGLNMEGEWDSINDCLTLKFGTVKGIFWADEEEFTIHNVRMKEPRKVLELIEKKLIKKFNIDLNKFEPVKVPPIKNVIFNDPATIVFWVDGTKTVVKAQDEAYDPEKGMAMAIAKKALGNQGNYCNVFKKWLPEEEEVKEEEIIGKVYEHIIDPNGALTLKCKVDNTNVVFKGIIE